MSGIMKVQPFDRLLAWILQEYAENGTIFGIHRSLFYTPMPDAPFAVEEIFGDYLATPIGPAAGPHTQLTQNILCAWLCGGRFIELKTVQIMDELDIPRPCIDVAPSGEGYNVEWSQELKLDPVGARVRQGLGPDPRPSPAAGLRKGAAWHHLQYERGL